VRIFKCLAQAHSSDNTGRFRESDRAIRNRRGHNVGDHCRKVFVWENTTRKELQPLELTSKLTTEFAYNGTSRGLHKERYFRIDN